VRARRSDSTLRLIVTDNGPGPGSGDQGVGLRNTNARLREMYGDGYAVVLRPGAAGGTEAEIALPFHTAPMPVRSTIDG
jgi:LytS/YehU family sensor histidine kinase